MLLRGGCGLALQATLFLTVLSLVVHQVNRCFRQLHFSIQALRSSRFNESGPPQARHFVRPSPLPQTGARRELHASNDASDGFDTSGSVHPSPSATAAAEAVTTAQSRQLRQAAADAKDEGPARVSAASAQLATAIAEGQQRVPAASAQLARPRNPDGQISAALVAGWQAIEQGSGGKVRDRA
jgi:hypothetical protein